MKCGHPSELAIYSAETGQFLFCDLCDCRSRRNDAEKAEAELRASLAQVTRERDAAREALREARSLAHRAKVRLLEVDGYGHDGLADEIEDFIEYGPSPEDLSDERHSTARAALSPPTPTGEAGAQCRYIHVTEFEEVRCVLNESHRPPHRFNFSDRP